MTYYAVRTDAPQSHPPDLWKPCRGASTDLTGARVSSLWAVAATEASDAGADHSPPPPSLLPAPALPPPCPSSETHALFRRFPVTSQRHSSLLESTWRPTKRLKIAVQGMTRTSHLCNCFKPDTPKIVNRQRHLPCMAQLKAMSPSRAICRLINEWYDGRMIEW